MAARRSTVPVVAACLALGVVGLTGCGARAVPQQPIPLASAWHPGLFVEGYAPAGLGPSPVASATVGAGASTPSSTAPGSTTSSSVGPKASASPSASASDSTLADPTQATLQTLLVQQADLPSTLRVALDAKGTSLSVPSLTYCSGTYASESAREARRRTVVENASGAQTGIATEAVLYAKAADAAQALTELRAVAATCASPRTITSGATRLTFTVVPSTDVDTSGFVPDADRVIVSTTVDDGTGTAYRLTRLWQVRGRVLVALYYSGATISPGSSTTFTTQDLGNVAALGSTLAQRLDALDPAVVASA